MAGWSGIFRCEGGVYVGAARQQSGDYVEERDGCA